MPSGPGLDLQVLTNLFSEIFRRCVKPPPAASPRWNVRHRTAATSHKEGKLIHVYCPLANGYHKAKRQQRVASGDLKDASTEELLADMYRSATDEDRRALLEATHKGQLKREANMSARRV